MITATLLTSTLWLLSAGMQTLPTSTASMRNTFVVAVETVLDDANVIDIKAPDAQFDVQMQTLKAAQGNLTTMAEDARERDVASASSDMIFVIAACHIQAKNGADTSSCQAQFDHARRRVLESIRKHKSNGAWVDGSPS